MAVAVCGRGVRYSSEAAARRFGSATAVGLTVPRAVTSLADRASLGAELYGAIVMPLGHPPRQKAARSLVADALGRQTLHETRGELHN